MEFYTDDWGLTDRLRYLQSQNEAVRQVDNIIDELVGWTKEVLEKLSEKQLLRCTMKVCCISSKHKNGADEILDCIHKTPCRHPCCAKKPFREAKG